MSWSDPHLDGAGLRWPPSEFRLDTWHDKTKTIGLPGSEQVYECTMDQEL